MSNTAAVRVAVGILRHDDGRILLASRPADKPWPYWWELPGGKIEPQEAPMDAVARELREELGIAIDPQHTHHWHTLTHHYPKGTVILELFIIRAWAGRPQPLEGQHLAWTHPAQLEHIGPILPASLPILRWLQLPQYYLISSAYTHPERWLRRLEHTLQTGTYWVQFREPEWQQHAHHDPHAAQALQHCFIQTLKICARYRTRCLVNSVHPRNWWRRAHGVHVRSSDAAALTTLTNKGLYSLHAHFGLSADHFIGISAHNRVELQQAFELHADFAVLGHVLPTPSHPHTPALGWERFATLCQTVALPVYALGGQRPDTLSTALSLGGQGIAGMRQLLLP